jgi:SAM-dependent methyltransferase
VEAGKSTGSLGWNAYWSSITEAPGEVLWDAEPERGAARDIPLFEGLADPELPLVDLGCGNATQTRALALRFRRVIGADVSEAALALARGAGPPGIELRVLDALAPDQASALHGEIGDANVYVRGVLHQFSPEERPACVRSIEALLGANGVLFVVELAPAAAAYFSALAQRHGALPPGLLRTVQFGLRAGTLGAEDLGALFPPERFDVLARGESIIHTTHTLPEGGFAEVPALYQVVRPVRA